MTNSQIQESIVQNLLLGLEKQSKYYLDRLESTDLTPTEVKDIDKELLDINNVLSQVSNKTINYTVAELEALKIAFNQRLEQLNQVLTNLEINTLKIEFDTLTPEQKEFLKVKGDKGDKGDGAYELAKRYGFEGNEIDFLNSLNGKDGNFEDLTESQKDSLRGQNGLSAYELVLKNGFVGTEQEFLASLNGKDGKFEDLMQHEKDSLRGQNGLSSYELALKNGFVGTEQEYLVSLKGVDGLSIYELAVKNGFVGSEQEYLESLKTSSNSNHNEFPFITLMQFENYIVMSFTSKYNLDMSVLFKKYIPSQKINEILNFAQIDSLKRYLTNEMMNLQYCEDNFLTLIQYLRNFGFSEDLQNNFNSKKSEMIDFLVNNIDFYQLFNFMETSNSYVNFSLSRFLFDGYVSDVTETFYNVLLSVYKDIEVVKGEALSQILSPIQDLENKIIPIVLQQLYNYEYNHILKYLQRLESIIQELVGINALSEPDMSDYTYKLSNPNGGNNPPIVVS